MGRPLPPALVPSSEEDPDATGRASRSGEGQGLGNRRSRRGLPTAFSVHSLLPVWPSVFGPSLPQRRSSPPWFLRHHQVLFIQGRAKSPKGMRRKATVSDIAGEGSSRHQTQGAETSGLCSKQLPMPGPGKLLLWLQWMVKKDHQEVVLPSYGCRSPGVAIAEEPLHQLEEGQSSFLTRRKTAQKLAIQGALSDAFQKLSIVVLESGKIAVEYRPSEETIAARSEEELQNLIQVSCFPWNQPSQREEECLSDFSLEEEELRLQELP